MPDIEVSGSDDVGVVRLTRPPHNFLDADLVAQIVAAIGDMVGSRRAVVLHAEGRHFCAGADLAKRGAATFSAAGRHLYDHALDLYRAPLPLVVAVHGKAVGGGVGLALTGDLRVGNADTAFVTNFARIGIHPGFGISAALPAVIGSQHASDMLLTARPVRGEEAFSWGLLDRLVDGDPYPAALELAREIAQSPENALVSIKRTARQELVARLADTMAHERAEQDVLMAANLDAVE
jgi:2-(1,2-epoxy-1,2-dihydrophenyl)acetyl-CoA isomerase